MKVKAMLGLLLCALLAVPVLAKDKDKDKDDAKKMGGGDPTAVVKALWEAFKNKDEKTFSAGVTENTQEIDPAGTFDRAGIMKNMKDCKLNSYDLSNWKTTEVDKDATIVTYDATEDAVCGDQKPMGAMKVHAADVMVKRNGKWQNMLHMETAVAGQM